MRKIKFRGKALNGEKWYYGSLIDYGNPAFCDIVRFNDDNEAIHEYVDINTVGQFIGMHDKNGKEIYEGDIIVRKMKKGTWGTHEKEPLEVVFKNGTFGVRLYRGEVYEEFEWICKEHYWSDMGMSGKTEYEYEVIGNTYDNPELLKQKQIHHGNSF